MRHNINKHIKFVFDRGLLTPSSFTPFLSLSLAYIYYDYYYYTFKSRFIYFILYINNH